LKTGFKHEVHFNSLTENVKSETLNWSVDSNIMVPAGVQTEAAIVIEEMSYNGSYQVTSTLAGVVTIVIRRNKDGGIVIPVTTNIANVFQEFMTKGDQRVKEVVKMDKNKVKLVSKGNCHFQVSQLAHNCRNLNLFQFALKQYVELKENQTPRDLSHEMNRLNAGTFR
jgi:hypothetical protein